MCNIRKSRNVKPRISQSCSKNPGGQLDDLAPSGGKASLPLPGVNPIPPPLGVDSLLDYSDYWYSHIVHMLELPEVIVRKDFPNNESIVLSVLNETADAGILSDYYLNRFFSSYSQPKKEIKIIAKTKRVLIPPIVYQKGKLTDEDVRNIVGTLENAHKNDQMRSILLTIGFSGFRSVTREEIIKR